MPELTLDPKQRKQDEIEIFKMVLQIVLNISFPRGEHPFSKLI